MGREGTTIGKRPGRFVRAGQNRRLSRGGFPGRGGPDSGV